MRVKYDFVISQLAATKSFVSEVEISPAPKASKLSTRVDVNVVVVDVVSHRRSNNTNWRENQVGNEDDSVNVNDDDNSDVDAEHNAFGDADNDAQDDVNYYENNKDDTDDDDDRNGEHSVLEVDVDTAKRCGWRFPEPKLKL